MLTSETFKQSEGKPFRPDPIYCLIYAGVMLWLLPGLVHQSPSADVAAYLLYVLSFSLTAYLLFRKLQVIKTNFVFRVPLGQHFKRFIIVTAVLFPFLHWLQLGHIPMLQAFGTTDYWETVKIRQSIFENPGSFWHYGASICSTALFPFLILLAAAKRSRWLWSLALFSLFYAASLMQKSLVIVIFLPAVLYHFQNRNIKIPAIFAALSVIGIITIMLAANPPLRPNLKFGFSTESSETRKEQHEKGNERERESSKAETQNRRALDLILPSLIGLYKRVVLMPGEVVGQWFAVIPSEHPFAHGCGYRPIALLLQCDHANFSKLVYASYNPEFVEKGIWGTMNAASFMEDYANFGLVGLIYGGIILACLLYFLGCLFSGRRKIGVAINAVPLLYLSSGALLTLLLSGGWLTMILLYAVFHEELGDGSASGDAEKQHTDKENVYKNGIGFAA